MEIQKEYETIIRDYVDFFEEFQHAVEKILIKHKIPVAFSISGREKSLDSILEKHTSKRYEIKNTITELNDLIGLRIVVLFPEFKSKVVDILSETFKLIGNASKSKQNPNTFGYSSVHLILGMKDEWIQLPHWENHSKKKIEVQIRTLSEYIWAETSHALFYKRNENIPNILNRELSKLSALLEIVDDKLQETKDKVEDHFRYIAEAPYEEIINLDLNSETFRRVMLENSKGIFSLNDYQNKMLSSKIEKDYNILNVNILDSIIHNKIDLQDIDSDRYVEKVIELLEIEKSIIDKKQREQK